MTVADLSTPPHLRQAGSGSPPRTTHRQVTALLADPARKTSTGNQVKYLLSGIATCSKCRKPVKAAGASSGAGMPRRRVYKCPDEHLYRAVEPVDAVAVSNVLERLERMTPAERLAMLADDDPASPAAAKVSELRGKIAEALEMWKASEITRAEHKQVTASLRTQLQAAERNMATVSRMPMVTELLSAEDVCAAWEALPFDRKRSVLRELITVTIWPEVAAGIRNKTLLGASAFLNLDYRDTWSGESVGPALLHHCITNREYVLDLEPYEEIAASASPGREVLMLTAAAPAAATPSREYTMAQTADITWDDLDARITLFAGLTGYAGEATGLTSADTDVARYLAMCGQPARVADLRPASPLTDIRNAVDELADRRGYDRSAFGLSRALDELIDAKAATLPLDLGDELKMAMNEADDLALASGYALPDYGDKPKLPCDSPELVRSSWVALHRHYKHRLSAADFADARAELLDAAARFGFALDDSTGSLDPDGTPAVAASFARMPLTAAADEVDRYLAMTGHRVPRRSLGSPADLRLAGAAGGGASPYVPDWTSQADVNEAARIAQRQAGTGYFGKKPNRIKGQALTHDFSDQDDPTATANPSRGGDVHPEVARLMAEHNGGPLGQIFGSEQPQTGNRKITPKVRSRNKVNPACGSSRLAAMSVPSAPSSFSASAYTPYLGL